MCFINICFIFKKITLLSIIALFLGIGSCSVLQSNKNKPFILKEATYQSWVANDNEKGTDIVVKVSNVLNEITFDSLVFKGVMVPVTVDKSNSIHTIKGVIRSDLSVLKPEKKFVGKPDQLIYSYKGEKHYFIIQNIKRKEMKYF